MFKLGNEVYDALNRIVKYVLPALGTAYFGLAQIWGLPKGEEVVGTIVILTTFFSVVLAISSAQYNKEEDLEELEDGTEEFLAQFDEHPEDQL